MAGLGVEAGIFDELVLAVVVVVLGCVGAEVAIDDELVLAGVVADAVTEVVYAALVVMIIYLIIDLLRMTPKLDTNSSGQIKNGMKHI